MDLTAHHQRRINELGLWIQEENEVQNLAMYYDDEMDHFNILQMKIRINLLSSQATYFSPSPTILEQNLLISPMDENPFV